MFLPVIGVKDVRTQLGQQPPIFNEIQYPSGLVVHTPKSKVTLTAPRIFFVTPDPVVVQEFPAVLALSGVPVKKGYQPRPQSFLVIPDITFTPAVIPLSVKKGPPYLSKPQVFFVTPDIVVEQPAITPLYTPVFKPFLVKPETILVIPDEQPAIIPLTVKQAKPFEVKPKAFLITPDVVDQPAIYPLVVKQLKPFTSSPETILVIPDPLPPQFPAIFALTNKQYEAFKVQPGVIDITFPDPTPPVEPRGPQVRTYFQGGRTFTVIIPGEDS